MTDCVNLSRIQETSDGDLEFEQELIEMFLEDAREHLDALKAQFQDGDIESISRSAHTLKGSSSNIGATRIQDLAFQMEVFVKGNGLSEAEAVLGRLEGALDETRLFYQEYLNSRS